MAGRGWYCCRCHRNFTYFNALEEHYEDKHPERATDLKSMIHAVNLHYQIFEGFPDPWVFDVSDGTWFLWSNAPSKGFRKLTDEEGNEFMWHALSGVLLSLKDLRSWQCEEDDKVDAESGGETDED